MENDRFDGLAEVWGGFLGLLGFFSHIGCETWFSRSPCMAQVAVIIRWETDCAGMVGGPVWTVVGLNILHSPPVCTSLGCREGYMLGGHGGPHVSRETPLTDSETAFVNFLLQIPSLRYWTILFR